MIDGNQTNRLACLNIDDGTGAALAALRPIAVAALQRILDGFDRHAGGWQQAATGAGVVSTMDAGLGDAATQTSGAAATTSRGAAWSGQASDRAS